MSCISVPSISQSATRVALARHLESLKIQKHVDRALACIRLQPMTDVFIVQRQFAENLFLVSLQLCQELFELCFVEDVTGGNRPGGMQLSLGSRRNPSEDHLAEAVLGAL